MVSFRSEHLKPFIGSCARYRWKLRDICTILTHPFTSFQHIDDSSRRFHLVHRVRQFVEIYFALLQSRFPCYVDPMVRENVDVWDLGIASCFTIIL